MKVKVLVFAAFLAPTISFSQSANFSLTGHIAGSNRKARVYIDYSDQTAGITRVDSADVIDGKFSFKGNIVGYCYARLALSNNGEGKPHAIYSPGADVIYFYFGKENLNIVSADSLTKGKVTGSPIYQAYQDYNTFIGGSIMEVNKRFNLEFSRGTIEQQNDSLYLKALDVRYRKSLAARNQKQWEFAQANPKSFFGLVALSEAANVNELLRALPIMEAFDPQLLKTDLGKELLQRLDASKLTALGAQAPVFTQNDVSGIAVSLADFKGKLVLVEFWASWCVPCRAENPNLVKQYQAYKGKGFEIISVSLDSEKDKWVAAIAKDGLPWIHVSDLKGWNNAVGRIYGVRGVPASYLINRQGQIIGSGLRGDSLNKKLSELLD